MPTIETMARLDVALPRSITPRDPSRDTDGGRIAAVSRLAGQEFMPWQRHAADLLGETLPDGSPAYPLAVISVPRQSGKSTLLRSWVIGRCLTPTPIDAWTTAQSGNAARRRFIDATRIIRRGPLGKYAEIRLSNGSEEIGFPNGSRWRMFAPTPTAVHGETVDIGGIDEAWAFDAVRGRELMAALTPAGATRPAFQLLIVSSEGTDESEFLNEWLAAARAAAATGRTSGVACVDYGVPFGTTEDDPDLIEKVCAAHPAIGHTITPAAIETAREALTNSPGEFLRAYGNVRTTVSERIIPLDHWTACQSQETTAPTAAELAAAPYRAVAIDVSPGRDSAAVVAAWTTASGETCAAVVAAGPGLDWVKNEAARTARRLDCSVIGDPVSPAAGILDDLGRQGVPVRQMTTRDVVLACAALYDGIMGETLNIRQDDALDAAAAVVAKRNLRDAYAWTRRGAAGDVSPFCALTWAVFAVTRPDAEPYLA